MRPWKRVNEPSTNTLARASNRRADRDETIQEEKTIQTRVPDWQVSASLRKSSLRHPHCPLPTELAKGKGSAPKKQKPWVGHGPEYEVQYSTVHDPPPPFHAIVIHLRRDG